METGEHGENISLSQATDKLYNVASSIPRHERDSNLTTLVVIGTDFMFSCKFNYHTTMIMTAMQGISFVNICWLSCFCTFVLLLTINLMNDCFLIKYITENIALVKTNKNLRC